MEREQYLQAWGCHFHFAEAKDFLSFTVDQLSDFSAIPLNRCQRLMDRLSQGFGYRHPLFPQTFHDPSRAVWDFNTLRERPILSTNSYWLFLTPTFDQAVFTTFYYELLADKGYRPRFDDARFRYLETQAASCFKTVFPSESVLLNPLYPNGEELADALVLYDRKIIIVQCKSKFLTHPASVGEDFEALRTDLKKGIGDAYDQCLRALGYLAGSGEKEILPREPDSYYRYKRCQRCLSR